MQIITLYFFYLGNAYIYTFLHLDFSFYIL